MAVNLDFQNFDQRWLVFDQNIQQLVDSIRKNYNIYQERTQQYLQNETIRAKQINDFIKIRLFQLESSSINDQQSALHAILSGEINSIQENLSENLRLIEKALFSEIENIEHQTSELSSNFYQFIQNVGQTSLKQTISLDQILEKLQRPYLQPNFKIHVIQKQQTKQIQQSGNFNSALIKEIATNHQIAEYEQVFNPNGVSITALLQKGNMLIIGGYDGQLTIFDIESQKIILEIEKFHSQKICDIIQLECGLLACCSMDSTIQIVNTNLFVNQSQEECNFSENLVLKTIDRPEKSGFSCLIEVGPENSLNDFNYLIGTNDFQLEGFNIIKENKSQILTQTNQGVSVNCMKRIRQTDNEDLLILGDTRGSIQILSYQQGDAFLIKAIENLHEDWITSLDIFVQSVIGEKITFNLLSTSYDSFAKITEFQIDSSSNKVEFNTIYFLLGHNSTVFSGVFSENEQSALTVGDQTAIYWENGEQKINTFLPADSLTKVIKNTMQENSYFISGVTSNSVVFELLLIQKENFIEEIKEIGENQIIVEENQNVSTQGIQVDDVIENDQPETTVIQEQNEIIVSENCDQEKEDETIVSQDVK